jgi:ribose transport system substrate-binding protein
VTRLEEREGLTVDPKLRVLSNRFGGIPALALAALFAGSAIAGPQEVSGPGADPQCFVPRDAGVKYLQYPAKEGPFRVALVNGYVGNTWRIQMVQTAKAYVEEPDVKPDVAEFKVVSVGEDVAAQIGAIDQFINAGYDAIVMIANDSTSYGPVIERATAANVVVVPFDVVVDSDQVIMVNESQTDIGRLAGEYLLRHIPAKTGKIIEVRGIAGTSVDQDRHDGLHAAMDAGGTWEYVEVRGKWDEGITQKVVADAIAIHGHFDGGYVQDGTPGLVRALIETKHGFIPVAGQAENGFKKMCVEYKDQGLTCASVGQVPSLVAIAIKAAIGAAKGNVMPQFISVPIPYSDTESLEAGVNYFPDLPDSFYTNNEFPACNVHIGAKEIIAQTKANQ